MNPEIKTLKQNLVKLEQSNYFFSNEKHRILSLTEDTDIQTGAEQKMYKIQKSWSKLVTMPSKPGNHHCRHNAGFQIFCYTYVHRTARDSSKSRDSRNSSNSRNRRTYSEELAGQRRDPGGVGIWKVDSSSFLQHVASGVKLNHEKI